MHPIRIRAVLLDHLAGDAGEQRGFTTVSVLLPGSVEFQQAITLREISCVG